MKVQLSYTTINDLINEPHTWLCKQMGLKKFEYSAMREGKEAHRIIQDHVSGVRLDERLSKITVRIPIVERFDRDPQTHFVYEVNEKYSVHGYLDGLDPESKTLMEIKTSSNPWSIGKFYYLMQWKIYALALNLDHAIFITCTRDLQRPAVYPMKITAQQKQAAKDWINKGIAILEKGDFSYNGIGRSRYCGYINCPYCGGVT
jgi:hypothetical protein